MELGSLGLCSKHLTCRAISLADLLTVCQALWTLTAIIFSFQRTEITRLNYSPAQKLTLILGLIQDVIYSKSYLICPLVSFVG